MTDAINNDVPPPNGGTSSRTPPRDGILWMALGLFLFGLVLGIGGGFSGKEGSAVTILTGVLSFVGGGFLGYTGFRRRIPGAQSKEVDSVRVGSGLTCLSLGVLAGLLLGMRYRDTPIDQAAVVTIGPAPAERTAKTNARDSARMRTWKLNASDSPICHSLEGRVYSGPAAFSAAKGDFEAAIEDLCGPSVEACQKAQAQLAVDYKGNVVALADHLRAFLSAACERAPR